MTDTISKRRKIKDTILKLMMVLSAGLICGILLGLIGYILYRGIPHISWELVSTKPSLLHGTVGILPNILNTLYMIIITVASAYSFSILRIDCCDNRFPSLFTSK